MHVHGAPIQTNPLTMQPTKEEGDKQEMNSSKPCSMSRTEKGLHLRPPWERFRYQSIEPSLCGVVVVARGVRLSTGYIGILQSSGSMLAHLALTLEEINTLETKGCVSAPFVAPPSPAAASRVGRHPGVRWVRFVSKQRQAFTPNTAQR